MQGLYPGPDKWSMPHLQVNTTAPPAPPANIRQSLFDDGMDDEALVSRELRHMLFSSISSSADRDGSLDFLGPDAAAGLEQHAAPFQFSKPLSMSISQMFADDEFLHLTAVPELEHGLIQPCSCPPASASASITYIGAQAAHQGWSATPEGKLPRPMHQLDSVPPIKTQQGQGPGDFGSPAAGCWDWAQVQYQLTLPSLPPPPAMAGTVRQPPGESTFTSSYAMQKAYAAASNRFLWRLNVLEGAAAPADPYNNGLCEELSALMRELDQGLTNCLVHLGVEKPAICHLLAGRLNALPEPHEVQTMRQLLRLRLSFITLFTKAVSTSAVPSPIKSSTANSPVFSTHSEGSNKGRGAAGALATRSGSTSSGSSCSRGGTPSAAGAGGARAARNMGPADDATSAVRLAAAAGLAAEIRQKVVERFNQKLRANACQLWALLHVLNPKPSRTDKEMLMLYTGKTSKQVTDWFTNWRARHWRPSMQTLARQMGYGAQESAEGLNSAAEY